MQIGLRNEACESVIGRAQTEQGPHQQQLTGCSLVGGHLLYHSPAPLGSSTANTGPHHGWVGKREPDEMDGLVGGGRGEQMKLTMGIMGFTLLPSLTTPVVCTVY